MQKTQNGTITPEEAAARCEAVDRYGSIGAAARALKVDQRNFRRSLESVKRRYGIEPECRKPLMTTKGTSTLRNAAGDVLQWWDKTKLAGREPEDTVQLPDPKKIVKRSTLYDQEGRVTQQWISEKPEDGDRESLWRAFAQGLAGDMPRVTPQEQPAPTNGDLCACYIISDHHLGMYSWKQETGADYDIPIAERLLSDAVTRLVDAAPQCDTAVMAVLGDWLHYDSNEAVTPAHKNLLDADGRAQKMVEAGAKALRGAIQKIRAKHRKVVLIFEPGNHDPFSTMFYRMMFAMFYENEPGVKVDTAPGHFHYFEFGVNLVGTHHGHLAKMDRLPPIMANDQSEAWGRTKHRTWWTGHVHHDQIKEFPGCTVESFGILAAPDAYAASHGYRAKRAMKSIILHREHGEVARHTVNPGMFGAI